MVFHADAVPDPGAVVVEAGDAFIADAAVFCAEGFAGHAGCAEGLAVEAACACEFFDCLGREV